MDATLNLNLVRPGGSVQTKNRLQLQLSDIVTFFSDVTPPERKAVSADRKSRKQNSSDNEQSSENDQQTNEKRKKRMGRRLFTGFQILELEKAFSVKPYLNRMERAFISQKVVNIMLNFAGILLRDPLKSAAFVE